MGTTLTLQDLPFFSHSTYIHKLYVHLKLHGRPSWVIVFSGSQDSCSRCVNVPAIFLIMDVSLRPRCVTAIPQIMHNSSYSHLVPLADILLWCLHLNSFLKKFPAQFQWLLHLITLLIISNISLRPGSVGIGLVVFTHKPVLCLRRHLFKIPGRPSAPAKPGQLLAAAYTSLHVPFQEKTRLFFTSGNTFINYVLLRTTVPN